MTMAVRSAPRGAKPPQDDTGRAVGFLIGLVAAAFNVGREALEAHGRGPAPTAFARQVAMYLGHTAMALTFTRAGAAFGRDRTTAAHACRLVEERRDDPRVDALLDMLERALAAWPLYGTDA
jgi:chromosomal replication initiation ATPase DnaA